MLPILSKNLRDLIEITPIDFKVTLPTAVEHIESCLSTLAVELLNYLRGDIRYCEVLRREAKTYFICDFHEPTTVDYCFTILKEFLTKTVGLSHIRERLNEFYRICREKHPDYQASFLISYATKEKLYYSHLGQRKWIFGTGASSKVFFETSLVKDLQENTTDFSKTGCKKIFKEAGLASPKHIVASSESQALRRVAKLQFPVVVKPAKGSKGRGVTVNIESISQLKEAIKYALGHSQERTKIVVEEHIAGLEYRFTCINGSIACVTHREPPFVVGDGFKTVQELILDLNYYRTPNLSRSKYLRPIKIDENAISVMNAQGSGLKSVLPLGEKLRVRENSNVSTGGSYFSPQELHPKLLDELNTIIRRVPSNTFGVDYITSDIAADPSESGGVFIEINPTPGADVLTAIGLSEPEIGKRFLNDCHNSKEVNIHVYKDLVLSFTPQHTPIAETIILPNHILVNGTAKAIAGLPSRNTLLNRFLGNPDRKLNVLMPETMCLRNGLPVIPNSKVFLEPNVSEKLDQIVARAGIPFTRIVG